MCYFFTNQRRDYNTVITLYDVKINTIISICGNDNINLLFFSTENKIYI